MAFCRLSQFSVDFGLSHVQHALFFAGHAIDRQRSAMDVVVIRLALTHSLTHRLVHLWALDVREFLRTENFHRDTNH